MTTRSTGRHRANAPAKTPLTALAESVQVVGSMSRRSAVVAVSSGLVVTLGVPVVGGSQASSGAETAGAMDVDAESTLEVVVPGGEVSFARSGVTTVSQPEAVVDRTERVSRSAKRAATESSRASIPAGEQASGSIVEIAKRYIGVNYRYGGTSPSGFDCSGYVKYVYAQVGVDLPRTSGGQAAHGQRITAAEAKPGDLVYKPGHIGIYLGDGMMIHAPHAGTKVRIEKLYFTPVFVRITG